MSFNLINRPANCTGVHRSGWPHVMEFIREYAVPDGDLLLDDFVEHSFVYQPGPAHRRPWVGIMHHPATINSPLQGDRRQTLLNTINKCKSSLRFLRGVIVLADTSAAIIRKHLPGIPVKALKHPTGAVTKFWQFMPVAWQVGFYLRDLRLLHRCQLSEEFRAVRSTPWMQWMKGRDRRLEKLNGRFEVRGVEELPRIENEDYDTMMAGSIVYNHIYGAAANNVVVECLARHTPIVVNRLKEVEQYLGKDYPLFYDPQAGPPIITEEMARAASRYLCDLQQDSTWLNAAEFAGDVNTFVEEINNGNRKRKASLGKPRPAGN